MTVVEIPGTNWAGNVTFRAQRLSRPTSLPELQRLISSAPAVRALGTAHSFSPVADTTGVLVSVADLPQRLELDPDRTTVTVSAGLRYGEVAPWLDAQGFALRNLGSLPHISVAGACATGTHGSGVANQNLSGSVAAIELVTATGDLRTLSRGDDGFDGAVVSLGLLGVVTAVTLDVVPSYQIAQVVYENLPRTTVDEAFEPVMGGAYSVSLFTTWRTDAFEQVWVKRLSADGPPPPDWQGAPAADGPRHPVPGGAPEHCTQQLGIPGPWFERLPHFRLAFTPSSGDELQTEYLLARADAAAALRSLDPIRDDIAAVLQISEIRTVAADDLWLSPSYQRDSVALHFTWISDSAAVAPVVALVEAQLAPFGPRPHWGKVFSCAPVQVRGAYPRVGDFAALRDRFDPEGRFANTFTDSYLPGRGPAAGTSPT